MLGKKLINSGPISSGANTFASENFNTVLYTGNGGTQRIGGYINRGAVFNGSSSVFDTNVSVPTNWTVSLWLKRNPNGYFGGTTNSNVRSGVYFYANSNGSIYVYNRDGSGGNIDTLVSSTGLVTEGTWHHIAITFDSTSGTGLTTLYIDGTSRGTLNGTPTHSTNFKFGRSGDYTSEYFNGVIDQLRIFNKELSQSEVTTLYGETFASTTISTTDIFDDNSGVALYQFEGNANDTGINVAAHTGKSLVLSGNNASGQPYAYSANITNGTSYTIAGWVKFDSVSSNAFIFSKFENNVNENFLIQTSSGSLYATVYATSSSASGTFSNSALDVDRWYHIAFVIGGGTVKLYMDGAYVSQLTYSGNARTSNRYIQFGWRSGGSTGINSPMDGLMEDVQFYNSALSAGDITTIYSNSTASGLVARWKFDDNLNDETGNYNATSTNTVSYSTDVPGARTIRKNGTASNVLYQEATRFQPDLVWIKQRTGTANHILFDSVRGAFKQISTSATYGEVDRTSADKGVISFDNTGFTLKDAAGGDYEVNGPPSGQYSGNGTYVAWCFNAGTGNAVNNTDGNGNTSTVKANQAAGFSIVKYTAGSYQADGTATVGHGLGADVKLILQKRLNSTQIFYAITDVITGSPQYLTLNSSAAANITGPTNFQLTDSVFSNWESIGNTTVNYCFADVAGYQKIGSYTGNGSSSKIVETGFEPAFVMIKNTTTAYRWYILDNKRDTTNPNNARLFANDSTAEATNSDILNFLSNGFELITSDAEVNKSGDTMIYLAIAADPDQTDPTVENSFSPILWSGTGSARSVTGLGFKPDLVWWKARNVNNYNWKAVDSINGPTKNLYNNLTNSLASDVATTSFDDDGFTFGSGGNGNASGVNYVGYAWKAGDHDDSAAQINTNGTINSIVSVNDAAGFSILKYIGNEQASQTVGHGLSSSPQIAIVKQLDGGRDWTVLLFTETSGDYMHLNSSQAEATDTNKWSAVSSTTFTVGADPYTNGAGSPYIAYLWYSVSGHSKIGYYNGNGSASGPTISTGFEPAFVMIKRTDSSANWRIIDNKRSTTNPRDKEIYPNLSNSEGTYNSLNFNSTNFQVVNTDASYNASNGTYLYMAFK